MRAVRVSAVAALAAAAAIAVPSTAFATEVTTTVSQGLPSELAFNADGCGAGSAANYTHVAGPSTPPTGTGSLRFNLPKNDAGEIDANLTGGVSTLSAMHFMYYVPSNAPVGVAGAVAASPDGGTTVDIAFEQSTTVGSWASVDLVNDATINWVTDANGANPTPGSGPWSQFVSTHSGDQLLQSGILANACSGPSGFANIDDANFGTGSAYDFEPAPASTTTIGTSKSKLVYGQSVTLHTHVTSGGSAVAAGDHIELFAKRAGTSTFTQVADAVTDLSGNASKTVTPTVNTTYKWVFFGDADTAPSNSTTMSVGVARKLTITLGDTSLTATEQLKAHGRETPAKSKQTVTIWRHNSSGTSKIGTTTIKSDGTWSFAHSFPKGKYVVYATVPKETTHIAATSPKVTVRSA